MDASEIYSKRLNAKEVIFPKQGEFIFPIKDGGIKTPSQTLLAERGIILYSTNILMYPELLIRILMSSKRSASMITGISMGLETCQILGQVSHKLLYLKKNLPTDICGPGGD